MSSTICCPYHYKVGEDHDRHMECDRCPGFVYSACGDLAKPLPELSAITIEARLRAAESYYRQHDSRFADGLRHALQIVQPNGWQHIAPAWVLYADRAPAQS